MARRGKPRSDPEIPVTHRLIGIIALAIFGALLYSNTLDSPFVLDDAHNIEENPHIRMPRLRLGALYEAAFKSPSSHRPVANASFALNYWLGNYDATGYHVVNIAIHLLNGILVYFIARFTLRRPNRPGDHPWLSNRDAEWVAFCAALVFTAHPLQTQAVTYVIQRMTSMAALFYLLALLLFLQGRIRRGASRSVLWAGGLVAWLLALGSKQISATLPIVLFLYEFYFFRDLSGEWLRRNLKQLFGLALVLVIVVVVYLDGNLSRIANSYAGRDFTMAERMLTQFRVVVFYISLALLPLPSRLNLIHPFRVSHSLFDPLTTLASLIALIALGALAIRLAPKQRILSFCMLWFFVHLSIESSIVGLEMVFEHRLYLPMFGFAFLTAYGLFQLTRARRALTIGVFAVLVLCLGTGTHLRNRTWKDRFTLWSDVVAKNPRSHRAHNSLGRALEQQGRIEEARAEFAEALRIEPNHTEAHFNLGATAYALGRFDEAIRHYADALRTDPDYARAHNNLAATLVRQGRVEEAIHHFSETIRIDPFHANAHFNLAVLLEGRGELDEALRHYAAALRINPDDADARRRMQFCSRQLKRSGGGERPTAEP